MHAIFFGMKRAFHASLRVTRRPLEDFGLTAARFDMLWCIHQSYTGEDEYPVLQSDVRKKLGVTAPTVTRMMRSLEALGLVRRERDIFDRRQIVVSLTREGVRRVRAVYAHFVDRKAAERAIDFALRGERAFGEGVSDEQTASSAKGRLGELLGRIRKGFGDRAALDYVWPWGEPCTWRPPWGRHSAADASTPYTEPPIPFPRLIRPSEISASLPRS